MNIESLKGVGPKTKKVFENNGIITTDDLISYYPFRYNILKRSNIDELQRYTKEKNIDSPISEEIKKRYELYNQIKNIQDVDELKSFFENIPLTICDIEEAKQEISKIYSKAYKDEMIDLKDDALEHSEYKGVDLIKLNGQSFNICIHRIFNFDFDMNGITNEIINNPIMSYNLFRSIELNYSIKNLNEEQNVLGNIQLMLLDYLDEKLEQLLSDNKISEIINILINYDWFLIKPDKLKTMKKNPQKFIGIEESLKKFIIIKEKYQIYLNESIKSTNIKT